MPADIKLSLLKTIQTQFDKLQNHTGLPSIGSFPTGTSEPAVTKVKNETVMNKASASTDYEDTTDRRNLVN